MAYLAMTAGRRAVVRGVLGAGGGLLAQLGLSRDKLGNSVTEQALNGIFKYMGIEEGHLRANPLGAVSGAGALLGGVKF